MTGGDVYLGAKQHLDVSFCIQEGSPWLILGRLGNSDNILYMHSPTYTPLPNSRWLFGTALR